MSGTYRCAYGCTSYNPSCSACEGSTSDQSTGWAESRKDTEDRLRAAKRGMTLRELREEDDES